MNIPNLLTVIRLLLVPLFAYYLYSGFDVIAIVIFLAAGATDVLDGYLARRYNLVTEWGKIADPFADKVLQITALTILTSQGRLPIIILAIVTAKEILMGAGSAVLLRSKVTVQANWYGKLATVVFYFAIIMIIFFQRYSMFFVTIAVAATLFAFFRYLSIYRQIRNEVKNRNRE